MTTTTELTPEQRKAAQDTLVQALDHVTDGDLRARLAAPHALADEDLIGLVDQVLAHYLDRLNLELRTLLPEITDFLESVKAEWRRCVDSLTGSSEAA